MDIPVTEMLERLNTIGELIRQMNKEQVDRYMHIRSQYNPLEIYGIGGGTDICIRLAKSILETKE